MTKDEFAKKPYAVWLDEVCMGLLDVNPVCIAIQMIDGDGEVYTTHWHTTPRQRAILINAQIEDGLMDFFRNHREEILTVINEEEEEEEDDN